ncbi:hypothetical protein Tco_0337627 [Tanacetum coccineum]
MSIACSTRSFGLLIEKRLCRMGLKIVFVTESGSLNGYPHMLLTLTVLQVESNAQRNWRSARQLPANFVTAQVSIKLSDLLQKVKTSQVCNEVEKLNVQLLIVYSHGRGALTRCKAARQWVQLQEQTWPATRHEPVQATGLDVYGS